MGRIECPKCGRVSGIYMVLRYIARVCRRRRVQNHPVMSMQLIWRSGVGERNVQVPKLQINDLKDKEPG